MNFVQKKWKYVLEACINVHYAISIGWCSFFGGILWHGEVKHKV